MLIFIAYDVTNPRRLCRVARCLERHAMRVQKSVFLYRGSEESLVVLMDVLGEWIDAEADVVQAWKLAIGQAHGGHTRGTVAESHPASVIIDSKIRRIVRPFSLVE